MCPTIKGFPLWRYFVSCLPPPAKYLLSLLLFYPTLIIIRLKSWIAPNKYPLFSRVHPNIMLGSLPWFASDIQKLHATENVRSVINMCTEWHGHEATYASLSIPVLRLPTVDFCIPAMADCQAAVAHIAAAVDAGHSVFVHCKAGKGRSLTVVLCYLVSHCGMTPLEAQKAVQLLRPCVSKYKYKASVVQQLAVKKQR